MMRMFAWHGSGNPNNEKYQFWQQNNQPIELRTSEMLEQRLQYVHNNPVKAEIVNLPEEYIYSSAKAYAGESGMLEVELLFNGVS